MNETIKSHPFDDLLIGLVKYMPARFRPGRLPYLFGLVVILILAMVAVALVTPTYHGIPVSLTFAVVLVCLVTAFSYGMSMQMAVHLGLIAALCQVTFMSWISGGIFSPRLAWYTPIPLVPFYAISRRAALNWLLIVIAALVLLSVLTWQDMLPPPTVGLEQVRSSFASNTVAMLLSISMVYLYEILYRRAYGERLRRHAELEATRLELVRTSELREQFIATVSHELRTPMNAILGFNAMLLERVKDLPRALDVLNHTRQSADHLMTVINDVLDHSQLQAGQIKIQAEVVELRKTVNNAFSLFLPRVSSMHLDYSCHIDADVPQWVKTDRHRLMQILVNLLGNAVKFTNLGHIMLKVSRKGQGVQFSIEDTGVGIPKEQQDRIFERFTQASDDIQPRFGGNGLGLSITKRLVMLMGGHIEVKSEPGKGSTFSFFLPLEACSSPKPAPSQDSALTQVRPHALRFLVVDDHPINRILVNKLLSTAWPQSQVVEAGDGIEALQALREQRFDLVIMDMVMPNMDGIDATCALRMQFAEPIRSTPVIGLTANVNAQDMERFKEAGLSELLSKPFDRAHLYATIEALVKVCPARVGDASA